MNMGNTLRISRAKPEFFNRASGKSKSYVQRHCTAGLLTGTVIQARLLTYLGADTITKAGRNTRSEMV